MSWRKSRFVIGLGSRQTEREGESGRVKSDMLNIEAWNRTRRTEREGGTENFVAGPWSLVSPNRRRRLRSVKTFSDTFVISDYCVKLSSVPPGKLVSHFADFD